MNTQEQETRLNQLYRLLTTTGINVTDFRTAYYVIYSDYPSINTMLDLIRLSTSIGIDHIAKKANAELTELLKD